MLTRDLLEPDMLDALQDKNFLESLKPQSLINSGLNLYAIIRRGYVNDFWWAESLREAQLDNKDAQHVVEMTLLNGPFILNQRYVGE